jgi:hypothetical protein
MEQIMAHKIMLRLRLPEYVAALCLVCRYNGEYVQTKGLVEQIMADKIIDFLKQREQDKQPFLQYYAPYAIHAT